LVDENGNRASPVFAVLGAGRLSVTERLPAG